MLTTSWGVIGDNSHNWATRQSDYCATLSLSGILRYRVDFQGMDYQGDDEFFDLDDY